jgi:parvulin-like peptidyl-prolyl isomerase
MTPSEEEITAYYKEHQQQIGVPERRKIQMVVLKTREEAEAVKQKIESGEITIYQAAEQFSIDPNAKQTLGEMDWVSKGTGFPALDEVTFSLAPNEIGGPVESPAGWHLVKVLDMQEAQNQDAQDEKTRKLTRLTIMRNRLNDYVVNLRTSNAFPVVVYNDRINELAKQEADWIAALEKKAQKPSSLTRKREEEYKEFMQQP